MRRRHENHHRRIDIAKNRGSLRAEIDDEDIGIDDADAGCDALVEIYVADDMEIVESLEQRSQPEAREAIDGGDGDAERPRGRFRA